ncbi:MAG: hypothetical protein C5B47_06490 [Verrucomicrobia bacterium]|nr:MAG: hypothetical protein C5B47_06490 [Verrucomicrobiota bacterium]
MKRIPVGGQLIALAFPRITENDLAFLEGFRDASPRGRKWEIEVLTGGYEANLRRLAESRQLTAAVGDFVSEEWIRALFHQKVRVIHLADSSRLESALNICPDYFGIAEEAARILQRNGCGSLAFLGIPGHFSSACYAHAFVRMAKNLALPATHCMTNSQTLIMDFICNLKRPAGIFAASDRLARISIEAARLRGMEVPGDIAVIGVGNRRLESLWAGMALSSFELPSYALGRYAAQLLRQLFQKEMKPVRQLRNSFPGRCHERESSLRVSGGGLEKAVAYIKSHLEIAGNNVELLAQIAGMSRRSFEMAMRRNYRASPARFVQELRMQKAKNLLTRSKLTISEISHACGYSETSVFCAAFRRWIGTSAGEFRRLHCVFQRKRKGAE